MAPRKVTGGDPPSNKSVVNARVKKSRKVGLVRRQQNGLLNVDRKRGKHVKTIQQNAQIALLRLPGEIRNRIWEFAIGRHVYNVGNTYDEYMSGEDIRIRRVKNESSTGVALVRVCRQIYAEAALLPYQLGAFCFDSVEAFDWVRKLPKAGMENLTEVHTNWHWHTWDFLMYHETLAHDLAIKSLPALRRIVVKLMGEVFDWELDLVEIGEEKEKFEERIKAERNDVEIIFED